MIEDSERCYRAVASRDPRFDGWFVVGVTSTGIYCRPSCPARTPSRERVRFYPTAAAAQGAGFRACKRCRPDATPGSPEWNVRSDLVARAMRLIADGTVEREGVPGVARRLHVSERHLHRLLVGEVGAGPLALARAQRAQTARILIETTDLPFSQVAFGAGFASIRQFNDTVREVFAASPTELRRASRHRGRSATPGEVSLRLPYRAPAALTETLAFLGTRAVEGVEAWDGTTYRRTLRLPHGTGTVTITPAETHVEARLRLGDLRDLQASVQRCRRLLDLDADPQAVGEVLGADPLLAPLLAATPGRRVPGHVDPAELAVRAVLGQQVSVAGAVHAARRLTLHCGTELAAPEVGLTHLFPSSEAIADAPDEALAMPGARAATVRSLASALAAGRLELDPADDRAAQREALEALPGIGPWTSGYIAMRALGDPDVFLANDVAVQRGLAHSGMAHPTEATARAEAWRPWRSYAVLHLWAAG